MAHRNHKPNNLSLGEVPRFSDEREMGVKNAFLTENRQSEMVRYKVKKLQHGLGTKCLQCLDTVGWAAGRASGLYKTEP